MHIIDDWGTGIQKIINGCREYGISDPEFIEIGTSFRVNIYRDNNPLAVNGQSQDGGANDANNDANDANSDANQIDFNLDENDFKVMRCIEKNPKITYEELVKQTGFGRKTVERRIQVLKEKGMIRRVGGTRGSWEVIIRGKSND